MILQKVLAAGRSASIKKVVSPSTDLMAMTKRNKAVATPPTEKMSKGEQIFFGLMIPVAIMSVPTWIVCHLSEYAGQ